MKKNFFAIVAVVTLLLWGRSIQAEANIIEKKITLGVLARNGRSKAIKQWAATAEYLTAYIDRTVTVVPLAFKDILPAVESKQVDFVIINPSLFVTAKVKYSAWPVVTMKTAGNDKFGAVVFTAASNKKINTLKDLRAKKFGAVQRSSLGGWQMAHKEFADAGIDIYNFFSSRNH